MNILGQRIRMRREELGLSQEKLAQMLGYVSRSSITKIENGTNQLTQPKIEEFAKALGVSPSFLMGWENNPIKDSTPKGLYKLDNILPIATQKIPFVGAIACGKPIYADEDKESYIVLGTDIKADFCLKATGDSMIDARINDGDLVFVRKQDTVNNGEVAVVLIGDEATLKRVYYYPDKHKLVLQPANSKYEPFVYMGEELEQIRILGKAVAFQSDVI